jgi:hypothetical protein
VRVPGGQCRFHITHVLFLYHTAVADAVGSLVVTAIPGSRADDFITDRSRNGRVRSTVSAHGPSVSRSGEAIRLALGEGAIVFVSPSMLTQILNRVSRPELEQDES